MATGHCKHGEFDLEKGCKKCMAEFMAESSGAVESPRITVDEIDDSLKMESEITRTAAIMIAPEKDASVLALYGEGVKLRDYARDRVIAIDADLTPATDDLVLIAKLLKAIKAKEAEYCKPIKEHLDRVQTAFKEFNTPLVEANTLNREKITAYRVWLSIRGKL